MVWAGLTHDNKTPLHTVQGNLAAVGFVDQNIEPHILPFLQSNQGVLLQQDNVRPHIARHILNFLGAYNSKPMPWPAKSPDLKFIANVRNTLDMSIQKRLVKLRNLA